MRWRRACESNACLEVAFGRDHVYLRSTADGRALVVTNEEWDQFAAGVRAGRFERREM